MKKIYEKPQAIVTTFNTVDATNANIKSVATLTLHIPSSIAFLTNSSGTSDAPCKTKGTDTFSLILTNLSKSNLGVPLYNP